MMKADKSILHARNVLLGHALSTETDSRVVSTCELLALQGMSWVQCSHVAMADQGLGIGSINDALEPLDRPVDAQTFETVHKGIREFDAWLEEWDNIMGQSQAHQ